MRVAVVGATGLLGRRVVASLRARGDEVVALVRGAKDVPGSTVVVWDAASGPVPAGALDGCDALVNVAGSPMDRRWNRQVKHDIVASRVDVTRELVAALGPGGPRVLVNASAVGFYGSREEPADESAPAGEGFLADVCRRWEQAAQGAEAKGVRVVRLRNGVILAPDGGALPRILRPAKLGLAGPIAGGRQWFPWIHVADSVGLVLRAIDDESIAGPVNLVAPGIVRQGEFAKALGHAIGRPAVTPTPGFAIKAMLGEGAQIVLEGQNVVPRVALDRGYDFMFRGPAGALADLVD